jgi:hypothetical protein
MATLIGLTILAIVNLFHLRVIFMNSIKMSQRVMQKHMMHMKIVPAMGVYLPKKYGR